MRAQPAPESVQAGTPPRAQASTHLGEASRAQARSAEHGVVGASHHLRGLKENVIMGRLIPAGTGVVAYKSLHIIVEGEPVEQRSVVPPRAPEPLTAVNEE